VVLVVVEVVLFPTFAHDAARRAAAETVRAAERAAEVVYEATVGTDCVRCRRRAVADAQGVLDEIKDRLTAQNTLLVQAAAEPHLWSAKFPLAPYQTLAVDLENVRRILGLMRAALSAMSLPQRRDNQRRGGGGGGGGGGSSGGGGGSDGGGVGSGGGGGGGQGGGGTHGVHYDGQTLSGGASSGGGGDEAGDPARGQMRALLLPTDAFVTELRRAVKTRLSRAAEDLSTGRVACIFASRPLASHVRLNQ
jgi:hypothetical protein